MLLQIGDKRYPVRDLEQLSLRLAAQLQHELASGTFDRITSVRSMDDLRGVLGTWGNLPKAEKVRHPEAMFLTCLTVWASRAMAGEDLSLLDAVDVPMSAVEWIREPSDRQEAPGPKARPGGQSGHARQAPRRAKGKRKH